MERKYLMPHLYLAFGSAVADGVTITNLTHSLIEGNLEKSLLWTGLTIINTASTFGNAYIFIKDLFSDRNI